MSLPGVMIVDMSGGSGADIRGQIFTDSGVAVGDEFRGQQLCYWRSSQYDAEVTGLEDGGFVVTWDVLCEPRSRLKTAKAVVTGVYARRFDADGTSLRY